MSEISLPTPGPWRASGASVNAHHRGTGLRTGVIAVAGGHRSVAEKKANAKLLAAAHDLLAALLTTQCPGGGWNGMRPDTDPTVQNCLAAGMCGCTAGDAVRKAAE